jgi:peptide/nickel transport system permease protein
MTFVARRLLASVPVVIGITLVAFLLMHLVPGDPAAALLFGTNATPEQIDQLRESLGLNDSLVQQYLTFMGNLVQADLGTSYATNADVTTELGARLPSTIQLTVAAMTVAILVGVPLGLVGGYWPGSWLDNAARVVSFVGAAVPYFLVALLMIIVFAVRLGWAPAIDDGTTASLVIPAISLGWGYAAILTRLVRGRVIEEYSSDYVKSARARGASEPRVLFGHVLRNSSIPALTMIGLQFGNVLTGAAVTEVIFGRPGLGSYLATAITTLNLPVVQGAIVVIGVAYVLINLLVDIAIGAIDPRARSAGAT